MGLGSITLASLSDGSALKLPAAASTAAGAEVAAAGHLDVIAGARVEAEMAGQHEKLRADSEWSSVIANPVLRTGEGGEERKRVTEEPPLRNAGIAEASFHPKACGTRRADEGACRNAAGPLPDGNRQMIRTGLVIATARDGESESGEPTMGQHVAVVGGAVGRPPDSRMT